MGRAVLAGLFLTTAIVVRAETTSGSLEAQLDAIFEAPKWKSSWWGVKVMDLETSKVLYEKNAEKAFMPASNMKLVTTAAAVSALGPDYRYETKIYRNGPVKDGVLQGDLVVVGSGDPSISNRYSQDRFDDASRKAKEAGEVDPETAVAPVLQRWAEAVQQSGIRRITGAVIADDDVFDDRGRSSTWQLSYYPEYYSAESSGFAVKDNCWDVVIKPGDRVGAPARLEVPLGTQYVTFRNKIVTAPALYAKKPEAEAPDSQNVTESTSSRNLSFPDPSLTIERSLDGNDVTLSGTIPLDRPPYEEWGAVHNGTLYGATLFVEALQRAGVRVGQGPKDADDLADKARRIDRKGLVQLHVHHSPPVSELIRIINKPSQNFYADMLQRTVGVFVSRKEGSFETGEKGVRDALTSAGVNGAVMPELRMEDGSGLSRQNRVTPALLTELLAAMHRQPEHIRSAFLASLPVMGVDGTLRTRLRGTPAEKNVFAKTGTIGGVRALSGYVKSADGHQLAFSMLANHFTLPTKAATDAQDEALLTLLQHRVGETVTPSETSEARQ